MYDENCYYNANDPVNTTAGGVPGGGGHVLPNCSFMDGSLNIPSFSLEQLPNPNKEGAASSMDFDQLEDVLHDPCITMPANSLDQPYDHHLHQDPPGHNQYFNSFNNLSYSQTPTPDLLNLFHFPTSLEFLGEIPTNGNVLYQTTLPLHLDLPPQQTPIFKDLLQSLPHNYGLGGTRGGGSGMDERDMSGMVYQGGDIASQYELDFSSGMTKGAQGKGPRQHFATERQRREQLNDKYKSLRLLVPNPTKGDRASIVHDAIEYIKELLRTVDELKILVDKKRYGRERSKRLKTEDKAEGDMESSSMKPLISSMTDRELSNGTTRSTWLQRKSKDTEVDVRIIEDEVTIKLTQRKKMNCLLSVSKILDELQLGLLHLSGGSIGDHYSFLFNTKIYQGSSVYAHAIAKKLIEAVDKNYAAFQPGAF